MKEKTQEDKVLEYMIKHGGITTMEAFNELNITRLSAKIFNLKAKLSDWTIKDVWVVKDKKGNKLKKPYKRYYLEVIE